MTSKMKKMVLLIVVVMMALLIAACDKDGGTATKDETLKIMYVNSGTLGEMGIGDIIMEALNDFAEETGAQVNVFECHADASLYAPTMRDVASTGEYDLIVTAFYNMREAVMEAAERYPNQKIILFDSEIEFDGDKYPNVRSVMAKQNEAAFLAGVLAGLLTESDAELANEEKVVGFVGAAENTAIQDFLVGYIEGVNYVDSEINVLYSFVGNWTDTARAKELGLTQYRQGADVVFAVCGSAGLGVAEAARETNNYNIGVDYDFALAIKDTNPRTAEHIVTSAVKDFYNITMNELESFADGSIEWGAHTIYDYARGGSTLVRNEYFDKIVPEDVLKRYEEITEELAAGKIEVGTAIGATQEEIEQFKAEARPFSR